jgi:Zn-dependent peptidase ImmA (M78 family)/DNA-binding XRE family transcriptional regulator
MTRGERFKQAREFKGLTQIELAQQLGVDPSLIGQIESGYKLPSEHLVKITAFKLGFPPNYFHSEITNDFPFGSLALRSHVSVLIKRDKLRAYRHAQMAFEITELLAQSVSQVRVRLPQLDDDALEAARVLRAEFALSPDRPIINLVNVLEKHGLLVLYLPIAVGGLNAFSLRTPVTEKPVIAVCAGKPADNVRFSLGHELYHLIVPAKGTPKEIERKANQFSAEFLMPESAMAYEFSAPVTINLLAELKAKWRVAMTALLRRAYELNYVTKRQYYELIKEIRFRWGIKEPVNIPDEKPLAFRKMAELVYGKPVNCQKLASDAKKPLAVVKDILSPYY